MSNFVSHIYPFSSLTAFLASVAAIAAGRAIATAWRSWWWIFVAAIPLAIAARLLNFMLVGQTSTMPFVLLTIATTTLSAFVGFRVQRRWQMARQYPWLLGGRSMTKD